MLRTGQPIENKPGLRDYWQIVLRRKWLLALPVVIIVFIAIPGSFLMKPVYQASTTLISQEVERGSILQGVANIPIPRGEQMNTVRQKIQSRVQMKEVAEKTGIAEYLESIGKTSTIDDMVKYLRQITSLRPLGVSIIEISVLHHDPQMAANIANNMAITYVNNAKKWRQTTASASSDFIRNELEVYRQQLREAEEALLTSQEAGVEDALSSEDSNLIKQLAQLRADKVEVELDLAEAETELGDIRRLIDGGSLRSQPSSSYADPEITRLRAELTGLQAQYSELSKSYKDEYPEIRMVKGEITRVETELKQAEASQSSDQDNITEQMQYWENRVRTLKVRQATLNSKIADYDRELRNLPQRQLELSRLERDKVAAERTYSMLLQRLNESELLQAAERREMDRVAEVMDPAVVPERPVRPNKKRIVVLAFAMGIAIGFGSVFLLEYFDRSFRSVDEVSAFLDLPVLAAIPRLTTPESEYREKVYRRVKITCLAVASLLTLLLIADIASAKLLARDSIFLSIARSGLGFLRGMM